ncbi:MAG: hypothetical protein CMP68_00770 [Flavobacteriales bacterium]|nr:hypothetical protein [Flavobacteriales bacterium]|tara:strand:+ start:6667 stop:7155 length:489 start_codon:yes stop_codon:yes gene_type:complete
MFDKLKLLDPNSRIWIFSSVNTLSELEKKHINKEVFKFQLSWEAHGNKIESNSYIINSHFIFIIVNSNFASPTGCSIDKLYNKIKEIGNELNLNFLSADQIPFKRNNLSKKIEFLNFLKFKNYIKNNHLNDECVVYDNSINILSQLDSWELTLKDWKLKFMR